MIIALGKTRLAALVLIGSLSLSGCSSTPQLRSDYDSTVDFSQYRTYNIYEDAGPGSNEYQGFFSRYMTAAIEREMEIRGYVKSDDPDLLVNFNAILQEKTEVRTMPASPPIGGYYSYRRGFYSAWPTYSYGTETHVSQYTEGTLNIDIVDARAGRLVWEAVGQGRVSQQTLDNLRERVNAGVPNYFALFPFVAGSAEPTIGADGE